MPEPVLKVAVDAADDDGSVDDAQMFDEASVNSHPEGVAHELPSVPLLLPLLLTVPTLLPRPRPPKHSPNFLCPLPPDKGEEGAKKLAALV